MSEPTGPARVEARSWSWRHAGRRALAIEGLDLIIEPGERVLLLGASGSGKSTVLAGLAGILGDEEDGEAGGELLVDGVPAANARGRAGLVLQDPMSQLVMARVGDEVAFGCENLGVPEPEIWPRVSAALEAVGLDVPLDRPTARLSGGQAQRLSIACALAMHPGLLLLDEPTANLDPAGVAEVVDAIADVEGVTLVVVEHRIEVWREHVTRVVVLDGGRVVHDGPPSTIPPVDPLTALAALSLPALPAPGQPVVRAVELSAGRDDDAVQRGLSIELRVGEALAITGENGVGKSTVALTLAGLLPPLAGRVDLASDASAPVLRANPHRWRSRELLPSVGTVFQSPEHQFLARSAMEELAVGPRALGLDLPTIEATTGRLLDRLGLAALARANPFSLSGGQQRRLSVGTALATAPRLLVLDEPTFGQDPRTWAELVLLLREAMAGGCAVVVVTHDQPLIGALGARELRLEPMTAGAPA